MKKILLPLVIVVIYSIIQIVLVEITHGACIYWHKQYMQDILARFDIKNLSIDSTTHGFNIPIAAYFLSLIPFATYIVNNISLYLCLYFSFKKKIYILLTILLPVLWYALGILWWWYPSLDIYPYRSALILTILTLYYILGILATFYTYFVFDRLIKSSKKNTTKM